MAFCIEEFASELCLAYATYQCFGEIPEHSEEVFILIHKLSKIFDLEFQSILNETTTDEMLQSFDSFMKATLLRYVKMSNHPTYFHFVLLCSLAHAIVFEIFNDTQCFTYAKITSLCLVAVYERCYNDLFKEKEELENLGRYWKRINIFLSEERNKELYPLQQIRSLLESLIEVDYKNFALTDFEQRKLDDILDLVPVEKASTAGIPSTNILHESQYSLANEVAMKIINGVTSIEHEDYLSRVNRICEFCDRKCFKFFLSFQEEILEKSRSENRN